MLFMSSNSISIQISAFSFVRAKTAKAFNFISVRMWVGKGGGGEGGKINENVESHCSEGGP
jgi:hypothetical protein